MLDAPLKQLFSDAQCHWTRRQGLRVQQRGFSGREREPRPGGRKGGQEMQQRQYTPEKIIGLLRQVEVELAQGAAISGTCS